MSPEIASVIKTLGDMHIACVLEGKLDLAKTHAAKINQLIEYSTKVPK